jgi:hypothetical protein
MAQPSVSDPRAVTRDIFSATIGSVCCCYVGQPFDTTKVRFWSGVGAVAAFAVKQ